MKRLRCDSVLLMVLGILVFLTGCENTEQIAQEFSIRRHHRYEVLTGLKAANEQEEPTISVNGPLSMGECVAIALKHNKDVQRAVLQLQVAKGQMTEAISTALPTGTISGQALWKDDTMPSLSGGGSSEEGDEEGDGGGSGGQGNIRNKEGYDIQLLVRQPIYLGGLVGIALDAARVFAYQTQQELRQAVQGVELSVRQTYLDALLARELAAVSEEAKRDAEGHLSDTEKKLKYGSGTRFDVLRAKVRLQAIEAELIKRKNDFSVSAVTLLNVLGVPQISDVELSDRLTYEGIHVDKESCLRQAMHRRPDLLIGEAQVRLAKDNWDAEKTGTRPKVYLQGQYIRSYPGFGVYFGQKEWDRTLEAGLVAEWPFFDGFKTEGRAAQAKAQYHQQQVTLAKSEEQVQLEVTRSLLSLASSEEFVKSQQGNVETAEESLRLAQVSFREGAGASLDVISAEAALSVARSDYQTAIHAYEISRLRLHGAVGVLGEDDLPIEATVSEEEKK